MLTFFPLRLINFLQRFCKVLSGRGGLPSCDPPSNPCPASTADWVAGTLSPTCKLQSILWRGTRSAFLCRAWVIITDLAKNQSIARLDGARRFRADAPRRRSPPPRPTSEGECPAGRRPEAQERESRRDSHPHTDRLARAYGHASERYPATEADRYPAERHAST